MKRHIDVQAGFSWAQSGMTEYPRPQPVQHFTGKSLFTIFHDPFPDLFHGRSSRVQRMISPRLACHQESAGRSPQESASPSLLALIGLPACRHFSRCFTLIGLTPESIRLRRGRLNPHLLVGVFWAVTLVDCGKCPGSGPNKPPVFPGCRVPHRHLLPPIGLLTPLQVDQLEFFEHSLHVHRVVWPPGVQSSKPSFLNCRGIGHIERALVEADVLLLRSCSSS